MSTADDTGAGTRPWPQLLALVFGAIYLLVGIVGFFITGFGDFLSNSEHTMLLFFMINPMHNVVHILIGVVGLLLARTLSGARAYGWLLFAGYLAAFVYGLFAVGESWDFLNLNPADNVLHVATAVIGLVIAVAPVRTVVARRA